MKDTNFKKGMSMRHLSTFFIIYIFAFQAVAQDNKITTHGKIGFANSTIINNLKDEIITTDNSKNMLVSPTGFNIFIQRKTINYLTGVSDLSLSKFYATYSTDKDKLNLGFNIPVNNPYTQRLKFIINPIIQADVKDDFTTLYKENKWENNISTGLKLTWLLPSSTMNFWGTNVNGSRVDDLRLLRARKYKEIEKKLQEETVAYTKTDTLTDKRTLVTPNAPELSKKKIKRKQNENFTQLGNAEADFLEKEKAYTWLQTAWISTWVIFPVTETHKFIAPDTTQLFQKTKFQLWEINLQGTYLIDFSQVGSIYISLWARYFQNNSVNAELMKTVDYIQYSQLPGSNPRNLAQLENNKAFLGDYKEFMTTNLNFQIVYMVRSIDRLITPGVSFRYERNWGEYDPNNLRFGLPLTINGKEKPINVELQYRLDDLNNYKGSETHKIKQSVGLSLGFPIVLLYK